MIGLLAQFGASLPIGRFVPTQRALLIQRLAHFPAPLIVVPVLAQLALFSLAQFLQLLLELRPK